MNCDEFSGSSSDDNGDDPNAENISESDDPNPNLVTACFIFFQAAYSIK